MSTTTRFSQIQKHPRYRLQVPVDVVTPAAAVEQLPLENISLGGVFIRTSRPYQPGSPVRLRIQSPDTALTLGLMGRVVHVLDEESARKKSHPPGMGVQFEGLSDQTQALLERFVAGLVEAARRERARRAATRFASPSAVIVSAERTVLAALWQQGLAQGGLYVDSPESPPLGARIGVTIGPLALRGDVVHIDPGQGFGVQVLDLEGTKREALVQFVEGTAQHIATDEVKVVGPPLGKVLAAARRLFTGIEEDDPFGGIGLPPTAAADEVQTRCDGLVRLFSTARPDASPPQAARIEAACRAVVRLEPVLLARVAAVRREAELATRPVKIDVTDQVRELMLEASRFEQKNEKADARKALTKALELAPDDVAVKARLSSLTQAMDLAQAVELVKSAEVFCAGVGMRDEAVKRARQAAQLTKHRDVRLLAVRVLAKAGENDDAILLAEELVDADPRDALAVQSLFLLHEKLKDWRQAAKIGEALLRLKPNDAELKKRVAKIVEQMRR